MNSNIEKLKNALPSILSCTVLKKEANGSMCGPCPKCGGTDRFVYKTDSNMCWCRVCHPEKKPMDVIDFHCWLYGKTIAQLFQEYNVVSYDIPLTDKDIRSCIYSLFCDQRRLSPSVIDRLSIKYKNHAGKLSVEIPYTNFDGKIIATQYLTLDQEPYPFTVKNGKPAKKVFLKGSKPGEECFFQCGIHIKKAKIVVISESVINAITAFEAVPGICSLALGSSVYTRKIKALIPFLPGIDKIIICQDNDEPGQKMVQAIRSICGNKTYCIKWQASDEKNCDINDLWMAGQKERVIDMLSDAELIENDSSDGLQIISFYDLCQQNIKVELLVDDFLVSRDLACFSAAGGTGKSMLALYIAYCLAGGSKILFDIFNIPKKRTSLFIQSENGAGQMIFRMNKIMGIEEVNREPAKYIFSPSIREDILTNAKTFIENKQWFIDIIHKTEETSGRKLDVIWIDPLISYIDCDENSNSDMRKNLDALVDIAQICEVTPIFLHHNKKDGTETRGASAIQDCCRNLIGLQEKFMAMPVLKDKGVTGTVKIPVVEVVHHKSNNLRRFDPFTLKMRQDFRFEQVKEYLTPEIEEQCKKIVECLQDIGGHANSTKELAQVYMEKTGVSNATARRHIINTINTKTITQKAVTLKGVTTYEYDLSED